MTTIRDIAKAAGCSRTTVSLALREHPRISEKTRLHVQQIAAAMGYQPDAVLGKLAANRWRSLPAGVRSTMAVLELGPRGMRQDARTAARRQAKKLGYGLDILHLPDIPSQQKAVQIMDARGIETLLLWEPDRVDFVFSADVSRFSVVAAPVGMKQLPFHTVSINTFRSGWLAARQLAKRGYRRPGTVLMMDFRNSNINMCLGAVRAAWESGLFEGEMPELCQPNWDPDHFWRWFRNTRPDALLCLHGHGKVIEWLRQANPRISEDIGLVVALGEIRGDPTAGCFINKADIAEEAVRQLHALAQSQARGLPEHPILHLIEPEWKDAPSLKRKRASATE